MKNRLSHKPAPLNIPAQKEDNSNQLKRSTTQVSNKQSNNHSNELVVPYPVKSPISRSIHCFDYIKEQQKQKTIKKKKKNEKPSPEMKAGDEIRNILLKSSSPLPKPTQKWDDIEDEHGLRSAPARYSQHGSEFEGSEFEPCWLVRDTPPAGVDHIRDQATFTPPIPRPSNPIPEDQQFPNHSNVSSSQFNVNFNNNNNVHSSSYSSSPAQQRIGAELGLLRFSPPCEPIPSNIKRKQRNQSRGFTEAMQDQYWQSQQSISSKGRQGLGFSSGSNHHSSHNNIGNSFVKSGQKRKYSQITGGNHDSQTNSSTIFVNSAPPKKKIKKTQSSQDKLLVHLIHYLEQQGLNSVVQELKTNTQIPQMNNVDESLQLAVVKLLPGEIQEQQEDKSPSKPLVSNTNQNAVKPSQDSSSSESNSSSSSSSNESSSDEDSSSSSSSESEEEDEDESSSDGDSESDSSDSDSNSESESD